jgi:group I intron endonuclease
MGFIYIIKNNINNKMYVGQTTRNVKLRFKEHKCAKNRLLNDEIKKFGKDNFFIFFTLEIENDKLNEEELNYIKKYNTLFPYGYNKIDNSLLKYEDKKKGGKSKIGHDKQSLKCKEKYSKIDILKDLDVPRGISYYSRTINNTKYHGFKVRKVNIKNKEFVYSVNSKTTLSESLKKAKKYLEENEQRVSASLIV